MRLLKILLFTLICLKVTTAASTFKCNVNSRLKCLPSKSPTWPCGLQTTTVLVRSVYRFPKWSRRRISTKSLVYKHRLTTLNWTTATARLLSHCRMRLLSPRLTKTRLKKLKITSWTISGMTLMIFHLKARNKTSFRMEWASTLNFNLMNNQSSTMKIRHQS